MSPKSLLLVVVLCFAYLPVNAFEYIVGVENIEYYPYWATRNGQYAGYGRKLLDRFAEAKGYKFIYQTLPVKRLWDSLFNGQIDIKYPDNPAWNKEQKAGYKIVYSAPTVDYIDGIMVLPENRGRGLAKLSRLGIIRGFTPLGFKKLIETGRVRMHELSHLDQLIALTEKGRVDGAFFNVAVAMYFMEHTAFTPGILVYDQDLPHTRDSYRASSVNYPEIIRELDVFLEENSEMVKALQRQFGLIIE